MASPFRYVFEDTLYMGFSEPRPLVDGRKVFGIICPDFDDSYFEIIETGDPKLPYLPGTPYYFNPFSQKVLEWFSDYRLLSE